MIRIRGGWKTFLRSHSTGIAAIDLFVVRTISFRLLYGLVILRNTHRQLVRVAVTSNPTAKWITGQVTEAFPLGMKHPSICSGTAMGRSDRPTSGALARWASAISQSRLARLGRTDTSKGLIGSIRRECLDHSWCSARFTSASGAQDLCGLLQGYAHTSVARTKTRQLSTLTEGGRYRNDRDSR